MDKLALPAYDLLPETQEFLKQGTLKMLIGGDWVEAQSGETIDVFDPSTGEKIAEVAAGGAEEIDLAVRAARKAFEDPSHDQVRNPPLYEEGHFHRPERLPALGLRVFRRALP